MEKNSWPSLVRIGLVPKYHTLLISKLQLIHDDIQPHFWESHLKELAQKWNLIFQPNETN